MQSTLPRSGHGVRPISTALWPVRKHREMNNRPTTRQSMLAPHPYFSKNPIQNFQKSPAASGGPIASPPDKPAVPSGYCRFCWIGPIGAPKLKAVAEVDVVF